MEPERVAIAAKQHPRQRENRTGSQFRARTIIKMQLNIVASGKKENVPCKTPVHHALDQHVQTATDQETISGVRLISGIDIQQLAHPATTSISSTR